MSFIVEGSILQEAEVIKNTSEKAIFRMVLQTADEKNQNKRIYPKHVLEKAMFNVRDRVKRRAFGGELDHPIPTGTEQFDGIRQTTVLLDRVSHIIRDYQFEGNILKGELETTRNDCGKALHGLLLDKFGLGVSMRGMAELERTTEANIVKDPLYIVSYDAVSLPSHKAALVDFNEMKFESVNVLTESVDGKLIYTPDGQCYLANYFDKLVETKIITFFDKWV